MLRPLLFKRSRHMPTLLLLFCLTQCFAVTLIALQAVKMKWACTASSSEKIFYKCTIIITAERYD